MKILAIGDIVSSQGCDYLRKTLPQLKKELGADVVIANSENSAVGNGILPQSANHILDSGVDAITLGNHSLRRKEIYNYLDDESKPIVRPYNYHSSAPGRGVMIIDKGYAQIGIINLQGAVYMDNIVNPFDVVDEAVDYLKENGVGIIIVDFHAEATSEKKAMAFYLDGRVSAVFGTHTHTQTSDNQIMPNGTGFISDIGMTGPYYSILGVKPEIVIEKLRTNLPARFDTADGPCVLEGCLFEIDNSTGKTINTTLIRR
ncbi:MAG: TIGR00282 family metallophosphoesterase [Eubacterium sp.]|nr:TIGR00282 family metallophosphoesterase [Eubacterium sp.]